MGGACLRAMVAMLAITPTVATSASPVKSGEAIAGSSSVSVLGEGLTYLSELKSRVERENACILPGCPIHYDNFIHSMRRAQSLGFVSEEHAQFVFQGLSRGFLAGVDVSKLKGHRWFNNYPPAMQARSEVTEATMKRVRAGKTILLGLWSDKLKGKLRRAFANSFIFPMGAVPRHS